MYDQLGQDVWRIIFGYVSLVDLFRLVLTGVASKFDLVFEFKRRYGIGVVEELSWIHGWRLNTAGGDLFQDAHELFWRMSMVNRQTAYSVSFEHPGGFWDRNNILKSKWFGSSVRDSTEPGYCYMLPFELHCTGFDSRYAIAPVQWLVSTSLGPNPIISDFAKVLDLFCYDLDLRLFTLTGTEIFGKQGSVVNWHLLLSEDDDDEMGLRRLFGDTKAEWVFGFSDDSIVPDLIGVSLEEILDRVIGSHDRIGMPIGVVEELDDSIQDLESVIGSVIEELEDKKRSEEAAEVRKSWERAGISVESDGDLRPVDSASNVANRFRGFSERLKTMRGGSSVKGTSAKVGSFLETSFSRSHPGYEDSDTLQGEVMEAFELSGVKIVESQLFVLSSPSTLSHTLVPSITIDQRLNFLIRIHTALFKILPESNYPGSSFMSVFQKLHNGRFEFDHPSLDLLMVVMEDTINWRTRRVTENKFCLPVLEPGMRINERIIGNCLLNLLSDYRIRWMNIFKDCVIPLNIQVDKRWDDSSFSKKRENKSPKHGR